MTNSEKKCKKRKSFKTSLLQISKDELQKFYENHSSSSTVERFDITNYILNKLLEHYNITRHSVQENLQLTCMEKYGVVSVAQLESVQQKKNKTCMEKYGYINVLVKCNKDKYFENLQSVNRDDLTDYYATHSDYSTLSKFSISYSQLVELLVELNISPHTRDDNFRLTCQEKYGVDHYMSLDSIKDKVKNTNLQRYGYEYGLQSESVREKSKITCMEKYGVEYSFQSDNNKEKSKQTLLKKYGVETPFQCAEIKDKYKQTCLEKYGVECYLSSKDKQVKSKQTCLEKYGVEYPAQNSTIYNKARRKYLYNNLNFDSSWELALYIYLADNKIDFVYKPNSKLKYIVNDKVHYYHPDFLIEGRYVEVKGDQFFSNTGEFTSPYKESDTEIYKAKYQCMLKNNVEILTGIDMKKYIDYVNNTYGNGYLNKFRIRKEKENIANYT